MCGVVIKYLTWYDCLVKKYLYYMTGRRLKVRLYGGESHWWGGQCGSLVKKYLISWGIAEGLTRGWEYFLEFSYVLLIFFIGNTV
jgi:hypothetical protein